MEKTMPVLIVIKGNTDGSIVEGDRVCYTPDGSLNLLHHKYGGWMDKDELTDAITDFEYEIDQEYEWVITSFAQYARKIRTKKSKLEG